MNAKHRSLGAASAIFFLLRTGALASEAPLLGVTYTHFALAMSRVGACAAESRAATMQGGAAIPQYNIPNVREVVRKQLKAIAKAGFDSLRTIIWFSRVPGDGMVSSRERDAQSVEEKVALFSEDVTNAGFKHWTVVFGAQGKNSPSCRKIDWGDCFDPSLTDENWGLIRRLRLVIGGVTGKRINVSYDLVSEGCPSRYLKSRYYDQLFAYDQVILSRYSALFGQLDARISCANGDIERVDRLIELYGSVKFNSDVLDVHLYDTSQSSMYKTMEAVLDAATKNGMKIVIGEMVYHNDAQIAAIGAFIKRHPNSIYEILQWPIQKPDTQCHMDVSPPFEPGNLRKVVR